MSTVFSQALETEHGSRLSTGLCKRPIAEVPVFKSFFRFLGKVLFGQYDEMSWDDLFNLLILLALIMGGLIFVLR